MDMLIWGSGAIGGTIGAYLARASHGVTFVDREAAHVDAMNARGLRITGPVDDFTVRATAYTPDQVEGLYDTVLLCVKAQDTESSVQALQPYLSPEGYVVSVQNGLNELVIEKTIGRARTVGSFVNFGSDYHEPGVIQFGGRGAVVLGELDGAITPRLRALHRAFSDFDANAITTPNIWGYLWGKLAYGAQLFATALTNESMADAFADPHYREVYIALAQEILRVAIANQITPESFNGFDPAAFMPEAATARSLESLQEMSEFNRRSAKTHSGVWRDLAVRKRRTEAEHQLGPIVSYGQRLDVSTPLTARLIDMIREIENGVRAQEVGNLDELKALI